MATGYLRTVFANGIDVIGTFHDLPNSPFDVRDMLLEASRYAIIILDEICRDVKREFPRIYCLLEAVDEVATSTCISAVLPPNTCLKTDRKALPRPTAPCLWVKG